MEKWEFGFLNSWRKLKWCFCCDNRALKIRRLISMKAITKLRPKSPSFSFFLYWQCKSNAMFENQICFTHCCLLSTLTLLSSSRLSLLINSVIFFLMRQKMSTLICIINEISWIKDFHVLFYYIFFSKISNQSS